MGLIASISAASAGENITLWLSQVGLTEGGIFAAAGLIYLLGHLNIVSASEKNRAQLRHALIGFSIPLAIVFSSIVLYRSLALLGFF